MNCVGLLVKPRCPYYHLQSLMSGQFEWTGSFGLSKYYRKIIEKLSKMIQQLSKHYPKIMQKYRKSAILRAWIELDKTLANEKLWSYPRRTQTIKILWIGVKWTTSKSFHYGFPMKPVSFEPMRLSILSCMSLCSLKYSGMHFLPRM